MARELRGVSKGWAEAIEEAINLVVLPADAPTLSFGNGADNDIRPEFAATLRHSIHRHSLARITPKPIATHITKAT